MKQEGEELVDARWKSPFITPLEFLPVKNM